MIIALVIKMLLTAVVVIAVTLTVAHVGPRLGGIVAGTPIVLGPAFFFLGREQEAAFIAEAAVSTLHALAATLLFTIAYVLAAGRFAALASLSMALLAWMAGAAVFARLPGGYGIALVTYAAVFALALGLKYWLRLPQARVRAPSRWSDLLLRGVIAGALVGVATTAATQAGPDVSGMLIGFPVGFLVIAFTLHQRFGAPVARATVTTAQSGMLSLVAFAATEAITARALGGIIAFYLALAASLGVSALLLLATRQGHER
ncbi:hypothetical protein SAMN02745148_02902 [Modicisalibacter ilicicola DSM 19980]|uniref:Uncharacterized protein n=1 Tax=Modicisalibacter ilicicola DSM 19980 TaxID=1121942 RepID=A0A1M5CH55_9GAMM|nr:hypothetical protein [Halomonas ilicicola]SHF53722.1 hypothetical protein SAMN02745148_02902 [Halomonas ilicicola DSM 19980]